MIDVHENSDLNRQKKTLQRRVLEVTAVIDESKNYLLNYRVNNEWRNLKNKGNVIAQKNSVKHCLNLSVFRNTG